MAFISLMVVIAYSFLHSLVVMLVGISVVASLFAGFQEPSRLSLRDLGTRISYAILFSVIQIGVMAVLAVFISGVAKNVIISAISILFIFAVPLAAIGKMSPFKAGFASMQYWIPNGFIVLFKTLVVASFATIVAGLLTSAIIPWVGLSEGSVGVITGVVGMWVALLYSCFLICLDYYFEGNALLE
ncbi:MAG: hypothetical protein ABFD54_07750 [Armatimonadota bacterium]